MSLYSDRILSMSAVYRLNLAVACVIAATSVGVAGPAALVESVVNPHRPTSCPTLKRAKRFGLAPRTRWY
jgi:hypothetical protein